MVCPLRHAVRARVARFFFGAAYQNMKNIPNNCKLYQMANIYIPNGRKIHQMALKYTTFSIARPSKIYPNWDFWFENMPSGNPGQGNSFNIKMF
jgi:hypothetical protein